MSEPNPREVVTTKALSVWVASIAVYIVAIAGRTSFGVAGFAAMERFGVDAAGIAVFTAVQLGVYAIAQIPTGLLIDRFGPRLLLVIGAALMGVGQILLGFTATYSVAIAARVLIGAGDATAFLSVMRILPYWFPLHRTPMFTQMTASLGQLGQFISAVPFLWLLGIAGWPAAFISLGAVGLLIAIAAAVAVADSPEKLGIIDAERGKGSSGNMSLGRQLRIVFGSPVAWQAFFIHYVGLGVINVFTLLWGVPLLSSGLGLPKAQAGLLLTAFTAFLIVIGPFHGRLSARASGFRDWIVIVFALAHIGTWVLFFSFAEGVWGALALVIVMASCSPTSNYGFDIVRENLDHQVVATATGLGNMGGFIAGMAGAQLCGIVLEHVSPGPDYTLGDFGLAALPILGIWSVGIAGIVVTHFLRQRGGGLRPKVRVIDR